MKSIFRQYRILAIAILLGMTGGFIYWRFVGCTSGSCPITSHWYSSAIYGGIFGYLAGDLLRTRQNKKQE